MMLLGMSFPDPSLSSSETLLIFPRHRLLRPPLGSQGYSTTTDKPPSGRLSGVRLPHKPVRTRSGAFQSSILGSVCTTRRSGPSPTSSTKPSWAFLSFPKPQGHLTGGPHGMPQTCLDLLATLPCAALTAHTKPLAPPAPDSVTCGHHLGCSWAPAPCGEPRTRHHPSLQGSILQMRKMRFRVK